MIKVLACIYDFTLLQELMQQMRNHPTVIMITLSSIPSDTSVIDTFDIDVCLFEYRQDSLSELTFLNEIHRKRIELMLLLPDVEEERLKTIRALTAPAAYITKPFSPQHIIQQLIRLGKLHQEQASMGGAYEAYASQVIQDLGIPIHLNGFRFIKSAAIILYQYDGQVISMVQLYREIARLHKTTSSRVEKAIRDAIEHAYRAAKDKLSVCGHKPTNSQLIHLVYECALREIRNQRTGGKQ